MLSKNKESNLSSTKNEHSYKTTYIVQIQETISNFSRIITKLIYVVVLLL